MSIVPGQYTAGLLPSLATRPAPPHNERGLYARCGEGSWAGLITLRGILGAEIDLLQIEEAIEAALLEGGPIIFRINSPGGACDEAIHIATRIGELQEAGHTVAAFFVGKAWGAGYFLVAGCRPVFSHPLATIGHLGLLRVGYSAYHDDSQSLVRYRNSIFDWLAELRPGVTRERLNRLEAQAIDSGLAESLGLVDAVGEFDEFLEAVAAE